MTRGRGSFSRRRPHERSATIRGLILDLDGVIRHWPADAADAVESRAGLPLGSIAAAAFRPERLEAALLGRMSPVAWHDATAAELEARFGLRARRAVEDWFRLRPQTDTDVLALVRRVRRVARIALLTNASTGIRKDLAASGLDAEFDLVLCSAELGVAKPDQAAFVRAAAALGLEPADCVVIDDEERNARSARAAGFRAIIHRTPSRTEGRLAALGLSVELGFQTAWQARSPINESASPVIAARLPAVPPGRHRWP